VAQVLAERARAGVQVEVLLEGGPAGGIHLEEKWATAQIEAAGGRVYFMVNDPGQNVYDRYRSYHPKAFLLDERVVLIGSENPSAGGMPADDKADGTLGHRGVFLATDAPGVVATVKRIFDADLDPGNHADIVRWQANDPRFAPPDWFVPEDVSGGTGYPILWPAPLTLHGTFAFELVSAPENSLRTTDGLLGLVRRAAAGDTLYVQQLQEPPYWGPADASPATDPNVRLEAFIDAARRGARVRLLLDRFYDDPTHPRSNAATVAYVNRIASREGLDLRALLSNVTGQGIHNKMVVAHIGGRGYVHIGSLNGGEASNKINRELALQVQSDEAYEFLARMFELDWALSEPDAFLPLVLRSGY
jgi:phosphatidylserine/phosphatidylglycerophosphate/cardiolipin synthase-like enzyme